METHHRLLIREKKEEEEGEEEEEEKKTLDRKPKKNAASKLFVMGPLVGMDFRETLKEGAKSMSQHMNAQLEMLGIYPLAALPRWTRDTQVHTQVLK